MADDIAHLISEITRSPGSSDLGGAAGGRANRHTALARGGDRTLGWASGSVAAVAFAVAVTHTRSHEPSPRQRAIERPVPSRVATVPVEAVPMRAAAPAIDPPPPSAVADHPRPEFSYASKRLPLARVGPPRKQVAASAPPPVPRPSRSALPPLERPSPRLTGAALERALAEDAVVTRQINLEQLSKRSKL